MSFVEGVCSGRSYRLLYGAFVQGVVQDVSIGCLYRVFVQGVCTGCFCTGREILKDPA